MAGIELCKFTHGLTRDHMGKYRNIFFFEAIALIEPNMCINHWKVLYKFTHGLGLYILRFYPSLSLGVKLVLTWFGGY
jgi:hypothetical protein